MHAWIHDKGDGNIALRMPPDVVGIDVDAHSGKPGATSFDILTKQLGPLPPTWTSTARTDPSSGIRFFRVPPGVRWHERSAGDGIELIHAGHRYAVVWPSTNPDADGAPYVWIGPTGERGIGAPRVHDLPELPPAWLEHLSHADSLDSTMTQQVSALPTDPFALPARTFTPEQAQAFVMPHYDAFRDLVDGVDTGYNQKLNDLAVIVGHFIPAFFSEQTATEWLLEAAHHNGSVDYQGERAVRATITSGLHAGRNDWHASRREPDPEPSPAPPPTADAVDALLAKMLNRDALDTIPAPVFLIEDMIDMDSASWIIGQPGGFKSFVALDWACHVGLGRPWRGKRVNAGRVVYMAAEGQKGIPQRVRAWETTYERRVEDVLFLPMPIQVSDRAGWAVLVEACKRIGPVLVVLDTQARITVGLEENHATDMGHLVWAVDQLKSATGACVLVVHHTGRNGMDARGSSAIDGAQDTEVRVDRPAGENERVKLTATISLDKQKDGDETAGTFQIQMRVVDLGVDETTGRKLSSLALEPASPFGDVIGAPLADWIERCSENQGEVLKALRAASDEAGATKAEILVWIKEERALRRVPAMGKTSLGSALRDLKKKELIVQRGHRFVLSELISDE